MASNFSEEFFLYRYHLLPFHMPHHDNWKLSHHNNPLAISLFQDQLLYHKLQCCNCGHNSYTRETVIDLSLEIEHVHTLSAALESFTNVEKMEDPDCKFKCEKCKEEVAIEKQLLVEQEPTVVALHLKRFKSDGLRVEKIDKHVSFPLELELQPFTSGNTNNDDDILDSTPL